jgi:hypothetical protein
MFCASEFYLLKFSTFVLCRTEKASKQSLAVRCRSNNLFFSTSLDASLAQIISGTILPKKPEVHYHTLNRIWIGNDSSAEYDMNDSSGLYFVLINTYFINDVAKPKCILISKRIKIGIYEKSTGITFLVFKVKVIIIFAVGT